MPIPMIGAKLPHSMRHLAGLLPSCLPVSQFCFVCDALSMQLLISQKMGLTPSFSSWDLAPLFVAAAGNAAVVFDSEISWQIWWMTTLGLTPLNWVSPGFLMPSSSNVMFSPSPLLGLSTSRASRRLDPRTCRPTWSIPVLLSPTALHCVHSASHLWHQCFKTKQLWHNLEHCPTRGWMK